MAIPPIFIYTCVCVCVHVYLVYEDRLVLWHRYDRYYKEKVIFEDIFSVPIIQNAYKSYSVRFLGGKFKYSLLWGLSLGVGQYHIQFVQYQNHYAYGMSPLFTKTNVCVCVCENSDFLATDVNKAALSL